MKSECVLIQIPIALKSPLLACFLCLSLRCARRRGVSVWRGGLRSCNMGGRLLNRLLGGCQRLAGHSAGRRRLPGSQPGKGVPVLDEGPPPHACLQLQHAGCDLLHAGCAAHLSRHRGVFQQDLRAHTFDGPHMYDSASELCCQLPSSSMHFDPATLSMS